MTVLVRLFNSIQHLPSANENTLPLEIARLCIYAHNHGLFTDLLPRRTWCAMQRHDERYLVIEPDGTLRTCPAWIGRERKYAAGHIETGVGGIDRVMKADYQRAESCLTCRYLPICSDCRVDALQKKGDILAANSHQEELDQIVPELVKAHYQPLQCRRVTGVDNRKGGESHGIDGLAGGTSPKRD